MISRIVLAIAVALAIAACSDPTAPTPPPNIIITCAAGSCNTASPTQPGGTPGASPSPAGPVATNAKVTIIGGDGSKIVALNVRFTVTYTRFDDAGKEVPGQPSDNVTWVIGGIVDDREAGTPDSQNYNRDLQCRSTPGTFTATATFGGLAATLVGNCQ